MSAPDGGVAADAPSPTGMDATEPEVSIAVDNDIVIKAACFGLGSVFWPASSNRVAIAVLGQARYVARQRIATAALSGSREAATTALDSILGASSTIEPSDEELTLAAEAEATAMRLNLALDAGESQLAAVTALRDLALLQSGDKRGIAALEGVLDEHPPLSSIAGRVMCLEQLVQRSVDTPEAFSTVADAICAEPGVDKAMAVCFSCSSGRFPERERVFEGLASYIEDVRMRAQRVLVA